MLHQNRIRVSTDEIRASLVVDCLFYSPGISVIPAGSLLRSYRRRTGDDKQYNSYEYSRVFH